MLTAEQPATCDQHIKEVLIKEVLTPECAGWLEHGGPVAESKAATSPG